MFDLIVITESWLDDSINNAELLPPFYNVIRSDRKFSLTNRSTGGGVFIAWCNTVNFEPINTDAISSVVPLVDLVACKCTTNHFYIVAVYIPPDISQQDFELFSEVLEVFLIDKPCILLGDFNIPQFSVNFSACAKSTTFNLLCTSLQLKQYNHIVNCNNRLLDLVLSNTILSAAFEVDEFPLVPVDSYHPPLSISLLISATATNIQTFPSNNNLRYNFHKADYQKLYSDISNVNWTFLENHNNVDCALDDFYNTLYNIFDNSVPKSSFGYKSIYPPWFTKDIIHHLKIKYYYRRKWKATKNQFYNHEFRRLRGICKTLINDSYKCYMDKVEESILNNPKEIFRYMRSKIGSSRIPSTLTFNDTTIDSPQGIVNGFADMFSSIYCPSTRFGLENSESNHLQFTLDDTSEDEVLQIMSSLPDDFSAGDDQIPSKLVREARSSLSKPLALIINLSISTSEFPDRWRRTRICPIFKKGDNTKMENYRPISIICNFAKIFESVIYSSIYFNTKSLISLHQHGFVRGRSTISNLTSLTQFTCQELDNQGQVDVIYTDFSKAFDTIDHGFLMNKLYALGLTPNLLKLIHSYLSKRPNYVFYNGFKSLEFYPSSGVPQGSNLGPLLFILYINDLLAQLTCPLLAYADDLKIYSSIKTWNDVVVLQSNLNVLTDWCRKFNLKLNINKCCFISYTRRVNIISSVYTLNTNILPRVSGIKDLGVYFDSRLSFSNHIDSMCASASRTLGFVMRSCRYFNNIQLMKTLYFSLVVSKLEYASQVWSPQYLYLQLSIEKVQRRFLKYLSFKNSGNYPQRGIDYTYLLDAHNMQALSCRRELHGARFVWKLSNGRIDCPYLLSCLDFFIPRIASRFAPTFLLPFSRTNLLQGSPLVVMCRAANLHYSDIFFNLHN